MQPITARPINQKHHDPFGMLLEGRSWEGGSEYRFGFNGKEGVDEIVVSNNALGLWGEDL
ncbi:MAG: hypothetical protein IPQ11_12230 [Bacteroidetes bacterium]|nr:hypothetical protein [Bacteroidota bacterium]